MSKLGNYISVQNGYAFKSKDFIKNLSGMPVIKIGNVTGGSFIDLSSYDTISEKIARKVKSFQTRDDDILIAMTGANVGKVSRIAKGTQPCLINQRVGRFILKEDCPYSSDFIYYLVSSNKSFQYFSNTADGAAQPNISGKLIEDLEFPDISPKSANKAGKYLKVLDEKIQLNTQINQTLEQIAQALFKSWFVDFDPVRAKVQALSDGLSLEQAELAAMQTTSGKTPEELTALSQTQPERYEELAETAKAFPCEMVEVDGVEVPKRWKIGTFTDITESRREKVKNDKATVLSAVSSGELVKSEEYFTKQVFSKSIDKYLKVYQWDFAYNPARINIGSIGLHEADYLGAVSPVYEVFSVSDKYHWFLKRILNLETTKIKIQSLCTGSVRQTLKLKDFQSIDCVIPDEKTLSIFNKKWEEYRTLILENNENTHTLSEIRDLLLPRLLSGDFNG